MRYWTLKGFTEKYVAKISQKGKTSINKLAYEFSHSNEKLKEPLLLYAMLSCNSESLQRFLTKNPLLAREFMTYFKDSYFEGTLENQLKDGNLPIEYKNIYTAYIKEKNKYKGSVNTKLLMKNYIEAYKKQLGITNYRIYTDLKINGGNFNDFMKNNAMDKLSLSDAKRVVEYLKSKINARKKTD